MRHTLTALALLLGACGSAHATCGTVPFVFTSGTTIQSSQVNSNNSSLVNCVNAIDAAQITSGTISTSRLSGTYSGINIAATQVTSGTLANARLSGAYTGITVNSSQVIGTTTNDNAGFGVLGEFADGSNTTGGLSSLSATDCVLLTLSAGDWDVSGTAQWNPSGVASFTTLVAWITQPSGTDPGSPNSGAYVQQVGVSQSTSASTVFPVGTIRFSVNGSTTIRVGIKAGFTGGTMTGTCYIRARRVR